MKLKKGFKMGLKKLLYVLSASAMMAGFAGTLAVNADNETEKLCEAKRSSLSLKDLVFGRKDAANLDCSVNSSMSTGVVSAEEDVMNAFDEQLDCSLNNLINSLPEGEIRNILEAQKVEIKKFCYGFLKRIVDLVPQILNNAQEKLKEKIKTLLNNPQEDVKVLIRLSKNKQEFDEILKNRNLNSNDVVTMNLDFGINLFNASNEEIIEKCSEAFANRVLECIKNKTFSLDKMKVEDGTYVIDVYLPYKF